MLFFGCNRSQETSFIDLKTAFTGWYLKANPNISEKYNQLENVEGWRDFDEKSMDEYFADIQRFFIELSQIDRSKLSDELEFEYLILWSFLKNTIYNEDILNPLQWDMKSWIKKINSGLGNLNLECGTLTAREENILKSRLSQLDILSEQILNQLTIPVKSYTEDGTLLITKLQNRILTFLVECESDSNIYERWDEVLSSSLSHLTYLSTEITNQKQDEFPQIEKEIWENGYEIYFGQFLDELIDIESLNNEIEKTIEKMLNISLPLYLKEYDEPIWVSRQDTLQVLGSVFDSFKKMEIKNSEIIHYTNEIIDNLEYQLKSKYFTNLKFPKFEFSIGDSNSFFKSNYKSGFGNNYRANFYLPQIDDSIFVTNRPILEYHIINEIFPGKLTLLIQNVKSSKLVKLLHDDQFIRGWELYIQNLVLKSEFINEKPRVALLMLENKLVSILKLKAQFKFMNTGDYRIESDLLFSNDAKKTINEYWHFPFPSLEYLIFNEIIELKKNHLEDKKNDITSFNKFISHNGSHYIFVRQNLVDH